METKVNNLLSKKQLSERLHVSVSTIDRWRKQGMPYKRTGVKLVRFELSEVQEWLDQRAMD